MDSINFKILWVHVMQNYLSDLSYRKLLKIIKSLLFQSKNFIMKYIMIFKNTFYKVILKVDLGYS